MTAVQRVRRLGLVGEVVLAFTAGAAAFALVAVQLAAFDSYVHAAALSLPCVVGAVLLARRFGAAFAVPPAMAALLAYDWYVFPPTHAELLPDAPSTVNLVVYLGVAVLVGELAAYAGRRAHASDRARAVLADEQAALRHVATLVARGVAPAAVFAAVAEEVAALLGADAAYLGRYESDGTVSGVGAWSRTGDALPLGTRAPVAGENVTAIVRRTGQPARVNAYDEDSGPIGAMLVEQGIQSSVGAPIEVDGALWGLVIASTKAGRAFSADTESRIAAFSELVATAISNTEARAARERLAEEQAALRRVATLVAAGCAPDEVFSAVGDEVRRLVGNDLTSMFRCEPGDMLTLVAVRARAEPVPQGLVGARIAMRPRFAHFLESGRPIRLDARGTAQWTMDLPAAEPLGLRSAIGVPIVVSGRPWGAIFVCDTTDVGLPPEAEQTFVQFTELVGTAIANAQARTEIGRLADEQAALRRVATLVAQGASPTEVFDAIAAEMAGLLGADGVTLARYEPGDELTVVAHRGAAAPQLPAGTRMHHGDKGVSAVVRRTERPARMESYGDAELAEALGIRAAVGAPIVVDGRLWGVTVAQWAGEDDLPAATEERMSQFAELLDTAIANADSRDQLTASRARLLTAADEARRRVVRDLHDGAQQRFVHTIVSLSLAQQALGEAEGRAKSLVAKALENASKGNTELRELAHGILPSALTHGGLLAGIDAVVARLDLPVDVDLPAERFPREVEASAYFVVAEALTNVVKHAHASHAEVRARVEDGKLRVEIRDDGLGGANLEGHGLVGMDDRVTALGGRLEIDSPAGGGTLISATLPV